MSARVANATAAIRRRLEDWARQGRTVVNEADTKDLLALAGIAIPRRGGRKGPFAVKLASDRFPHKTEHGLVQLNVKGTEVAKVAKRLQRADRKGRVLVEQMIGDGIGEWIVGCKHDATFGPIVLSGPGGIFVELLDQVEIRLAPAGARVARAMIESGYGRRILGGLRGKPAGDAAALADMVVRVSRLFAENRDLIEEIEINPVIVRPKKEGAVAVDALLVLKQDRGRAVA
jgi:acyl-CoA synthetase (NDP forming)